MQISDHFSLGKTQSELDFVDIDFDHDTPLFLDPYFLSKRSGRWALDAARTIRAFFQDIVALLRGARQADAERLFAHLSEPNETCLGLSRGRPRGRGVGRTDTANILQSLLTSRAIQTGVVEDIEDCNIFVRNFGKDKLSDMVTNIIRGQLLRYTAHQCMLCGIPLQSDVPSGFYWDRGNHCWDNAHTPRLVVNGRGLLLVPKGIVSFSTEYTPSKYYQRFVLNFLQHEHLELNTALVQERRRRNGEVVRYVTKKSLRETEAPFSKEFLLGFTVRHPEVFRDFRSRAIVTASSLSNEAILAATNRLEVSPAIADVSAHLIGRLQQTRPGSSGATEYHRLIAGILELLFYPTLICPEIEREIHQGRKRIDISFDNAAEDGFFLDLQLRHGVPCPYILMECKNYSSDPANPELDQLAGRFSPNRGQFGLLLCRAIEDIDLFLQRCSDTYRDGRGVIIPVVDTDLLAGLQSLRDGEPGRMEVVVRDRMRAIALR